MPDYGRGEYLCICLDGCSSHTIQCWGWCVTYNPDSAGCEANPGCPACDGFAGHYCMADEDSSGCPIEGAPEFMPSLSSATLDVERRDVSSCAFDIALQIETEETSAEASAHVDNCWFSSLEFAGARDFTPPIPAGWSQAEGTLFLGWEGCSVTFTQLACQTADGDQTDSDTSDGDEPWPDGDEIQPDGDEPQTDGDVIPPDGDEAPPDGDAIPPDGDVTPPDGDVTPPDGDVILPDGDVTPPDGDVTPPDGDTTEPDLDLDPDPEPEVDPEPEIETVSRIVVAGDSWSVGIAQPTIEALAARGYGQVTVSWQATAIGGSTVEEWANNDGHKRDLLLVELTNQPPAEVLVLVISGNDLLGAMRDGFGGWWPFLQDALFNQIEDDLQELVNWALIFRPGLQIAIVGYDYLHYPLIDLYQDMPDMTLAKFNEAFVELGRRQMTVALRTPGCWYAHNYGIMQYRFGDSSLGYGPGAVPFPGTAPSYIPYPGGNPWLPGPMNELPDGVHPSAAGFRVIIDNTLDQGMANLIERKTWY
ncbi:MAG: hypothetical protein C4523_13925 [Myxococcales bacterium]|nr:MAG: hypothetical protein C4523_13925 [Myxococcales bacterium]